MLLVAAMGQGLMSCESKDPPEVFTKHRPEFRELERRIRDSSNPYFGEQQVPEVRDQLAKPGLAPMDQIALRVRLGKELMRLGAVGEAIETIEGAFTVGKQAGLTLPAELHAWMGLVYFRQAEISNCIQRYNAECCIFPLEGGGVHQVDEPARRAGYHYLMFLDGLPGNLAARWMVNLSAMALGDFPAGVPEALRIPVRAADYDIKRFVNIAPEVGVGTFNLCGGAAAVDFDGDGWIDIMTSTWDPGGPLTFYRNRGDGRFDDVSTASRADDQLGGLNCQAADYDGDGDVDLLVLRGAWLAEDGRMRNSLLRNDAGKFTDVTHEVGLAEPAYPTQAAAWADFDNDGDLDLYVGNESSPEAGMLCKGQLFLNDDGKFTDVAARAGVANDDAKGVGLFCKGVAAGDYDNDGDVDLYVSNAGPNRLYRNKGDGTFDEVSRQAGVEGPTGRSFAVWFFDYDNDGWFDLFVAGYQGTLGDVVAGYLGLAHKGLAPRLYRNLGNGRFVDMAAEAGIQHPYLTMGASFGDLDNDGWLDVYLTTGDPEFDTLTPNVMLRNDRGKRFQDVTISGGFGHLQKGHGVAFADFDHDGDQDIYNQLGGFYPSDKFRNGLYLNPGHGNHFLHVKLVGTRSHRSGSGARIEVVVETPSGVVSMHRAAGSVSSFGGSRQRQEIGLGAATRIVRLKVRWPVSKTTQVFRDVPLDAMVRITEGAETLERLPLPTFQFR